MIQATEEVIKKFESAEQVVGQIMRQHWDMAACRCWVCKVGRKLGIHNGIRPSGIKSSWKTKSNLWDIELES